MGPLVIPAIIISGVAIALASQQPQERPGTSTDLGPAPRPQTPRGAPQAMGTLEPDVFALAPRESNQLAPSSSSKKVFHLTQEQKREVYNLLISGRGRPIPDSKVHALAKKLNVSPHDLESFIYALASRQAMNEMKNRTALARPPQPLPRPRRTKKKGLANVLHQPLPIAVDAATHRFMRNPAVRSIEQGNEEIIIHLDPSSTASVLIPPSYLGWPVRMVEDG